MTSGDISHPRVRRGGISLPWILKLAFVLFVVYYDASPCQIIFSLVVLLVFKVYQTGRIRLVTHRMPSENPPSGGNDITHHRWNLQQQQQQGKQEKEQQFGFLMIIVSPLFFCDFYLIDRYLITATITTTSGTPSGPFFCFFLSFPWGESTGVGSKSSTAIWTNGATQLQVQHQHE